MAGKSTNLIQRVLARVGRLFKGRRRILIRGERFDARLPIIVTLAGSKKELARRGVNGVPSLVGFTRNLSETGMTLLLPSVRIGDAYITDAESCLEIKLELSAGPVIIRAAPVRFEQLPKREAGCGYLLAVRLVEANEAAERERYSAYVKSGGREEKPSSERRRATAALSGSSAAAQASKWEALTPASVSQAFEQFVRE